MNHAVGSLVRSLSFVATREHPTWFATLRVDELRPSDEAIVVDAIHNLEGKWIRILCLDNGRVGWAEPNWFENVIAQF